MSISGLDRVMKAATSVTIDTSDASWYDLWHEHPDMDAVGNKSAEARRACLEALRTAYDRVVSQLIGWRKPNQTWVLIDSTDSGQDAIYVHTPNPNKENFPYEFKGVDWSFYIPRWITAVFPRKEFRLGRSKYRRHVMYWARRK